MENELLTLLAEKLGVSVENLWGVLLAQAPISATIDLCISGLILSSIAFAGIFIHRKSNEKDEHGYAVLDTDLLHILRVVWGMLTVLLLIIILESVHITIAGYFNPEYWALIQLKGLL